MILRDACGARVRAGVSLAPLTTLRIGGAAALYLEPESEADLVAVTSMLREAPVPIVVIGKGSNILVSDDGFEGLVLRLGRSYRWAAREGDRIRAGGSMPLPALAGVALAHGLAGLEWGVAIPASFGGAVRMNAGAHGGDMAEIVETIDVLDLATGASLAVPSAEAGFRYRATELPSAGVVTGATIALSPGEPSAIRTRMDEIREWRREHQPLAEPNCGSVFKNPPGDFAARLVDEAGCKGMTLGGASVSVKHANFIVASPGTRADDVLELIRSVQRVVVERFDVRLEPEVHLVGRFDRTPS
jgi:UDP-N-acetylmuramate dehydrogenase